MHIWLSGRQIWATRISTPRSVARVPFRSPLAILPLKQGGGPELDAHLSTVCIGELGSTVKVGFRTPFSYLPLIGWGLQNWWLKASPPCHIFDFLHHPPSAICLPIHISPPLSDILAHLILFHSLSPSNTNPTPFHVLPP
jgi:hypothetical protein